jgi:hypothetical protein
MTTRDSAVHAACLGHRSGMRLATSAEGPRRVLDAKVGEHDRVTVRDLATPAVRLRRR